MHQTPDCEDRPDTQPEAAPELCTIRQIALRFGITLRALRFYEDRGLLKPQRVGAARFYDERAITRLETILEGKRLGFTLAEISSMLTEGSSDRQKRLKLDLDPEQVRNQILLLEKQREGLNQAIAELKNVHAELSEGTDVASAA